MINFLEFKRLTVALFIRKFPVQWISVNKFNGMIIQGIIVLQAIATAGNSKLAPGVLFSNSF